MYATAVGGTLAVAVLAVIYMGVAQTWEVHFPKKNSYIGSISSQREVLLQTLCDTETVTHVIIQRTAK